MCKEDHSISLFEELPVKCINIIIKWAKARDINDFDEGIRWKEGSLIYTETKATPSCK